MTFFSFSQGTNCFNANPFCTGTTYNFPNATSGVAPSGPNYGCLISQPKPIWYYMEIATPGTLGIGISQSSGDIDFAMWGPFSSLSAGCTAVMAGTVPPLQCSFSSSATENIGIGMTGGVGGGQSNPPPAVAGQFYIVLLTNYVGTPGTISFNQSGGTATTNCLIVTPCPSTISYPATLCSTITNQVVTRTGITGGTYTSTPGLSINSSTGSINPSASTPGTYTVTYTVTQNNASPPVACTGSSTATVTIVATTTPTFTQVAPICFGGPISLPTTSTNSVPGIWSPAINNTATTTYTFTPSAGQCAVPATMTIVVDPKVNPTFTQVPPICSGDALTALPTTSTNGIPGAWSPALNNTATTTYTFTPSAGQCANPATMTITVNTSAIPVITAVPALCSNSAAATLTATPAGGTFSGPGVSGNTFNPATAGVGSHTVTYTTPAVGACPARTATRVIVVNPLPTATISYAGPYCSSSTSAPVTQTGTTGGVYSSTGGLSIIATSGLINPSTSTPGTYTVTYTIPAALGCPAVTTTASVTITAIPVPTIAALATLCSSGASVPVTVSPAGGVLSGTGVTGNNFNPATAGAGTHTLTYTVAAAAGCPAQIATRVVTVTALPVATIAYAGPYCSSSTSAPVTQTGSTGGTFTSTVGLSINASTGLINPSASTAGTYTVTYTIAAALGCPAVTTTASVTITAIPVPSISPVAVLCSNGGAVPVTVSPAGGVLSGTGVTGNNFNPTTAGAGTHTLTYTIAAAAGCPVQTTTRVVTVTALPVATISYAGPFCSTSGSEVVTQTGTTGGVYSGTSGLSVNASTGAINPSASTVGNHTVTYTIAAASGCPAVTTTASITINLIAAATINYAGSPYCKSIASPQAVTFTGSTGGTYTASPAGLTLNASNGSVTPSTSSAGTYTVTYTIPATTSCPAVTTVATVVINSLPVVTITPIASLCIDAATISVNASPVGGILAGPGISGTNFSPATAGAGTHTLTYNYTDGNGCSSSTTSSVVVNPLPTPIITPISALCANAATVAINAVPTGGTFSGTGVSGANFNPATAGAGTHTITYNYTDVNTCFASVTSSVIVNPVPTATILGTIDVCQNATAPVVTFTGAGGTAPYTFTYTLNGGSNLTITSAGNTATITVPTGTPLTNTYTLVSVQDASSTACSNLQSGTVIIKVNALPTATIAGTVDVCQNGTQPTITFTGSTGVAPYTFTYNLNGGGNQTIVSSGNTATIPVPTATAGNFVYTLVSVQDASSTACVNLQAGTATVVVKPLPVVTATPSLQTLCSGANTSIALSSAPANATYTWTVASNGLNGASAGSGNTIGQTLSASGIAVGTATYTITPSLAGCVGLPTDVIITVNPLPTVIATPASQAICSELATSIALTSAPAGSVFTWIASANNVTGSTNGSGSTINQTLASTTGGTVTYAVTPTLNGCVGPVTNVVITVNPKPTLIANPTSPSICIGSNINLNVAGASTYVWSPATGLSSTTGSTVVANPTVTQAYVITGTDVNGCVNTTNANVTVNPMPVTNVSPNGAICIGNSISLTATGANSYTWTPATGLNSATGNTVVASPNVTTTYTVTGTSLNCSTTATVTVTVNPLPIVNAGLDQTICAGDPIILTGAGAATYAWNNGVTNSVPFSPAVTTTYTVTGTSADGCIASDQVTITVVDRPIIAVTPSTLVGCLPVNVTFANTTSGATTYEWDFGDGTTSTSANPNHTYLTAGCFDVTLTAYTSNGCATTQVFQNLICTYLAPIASFIANPTTITTATPFSSMINTSLNSNIYEWDFGDGTGISNLISPSHTFPEDAVTSYVVTLVASNESGCSDTARVTIEMIEEIVYYVPNVFTPDGDLFNQTFQPVFTSGFDPFDYSMYIYNRWGELIFESHDALQGWDGSYLSSGSELVQEGTYIWVIDFKLKHNDKHKKLTGHVSLIR